MLAEVEKIFNQADGSKIKVVVQILTTARGIGAKIEYIHIFFVSSGDNFWTNIPSESAGYFVTREQLKAVERELWITLEPV